MRSDELRILILEDIPEEAHLIERMIQRDSIKFVSLRVDSQESFEEGLDQFDPDIVLSDHSLPSFNSIEALRICRRKMPGIPFILVTGAVSEEFAVDCIKKGADDYLLKSNLTRLPSAIKSAINHRHTEAMKKRAEEEIKNQNEQLRNSVAQLKKSNAELDNLVYSVSHNLRGPVSTIQGLVYLMKIEKKNDGGQIPDMILASISKLDNTIKEIITYSRNARIELVREPVDLRKLIDDVLEQLEFARQELSVQVQIDLEEEFVWCDRFRLSVIMNNLLSNSLKYADRSKNGLFLEIRSTRTRGHHLEITIQDNGIGISPEVLPFVYNMFYRGTEKSDGAGLGLYIVREAVERLGGTVELKSRQHEGTIATVSLPMTDEFGSGKMHHSSTLWMKQK